jgi:hypothetical protein
MGAGHHCFARDTHPPKSVWCVYPIAKSSMIHDNFVRGVNGWAHLGTVSTTS